MSTVRTSFAEQIEELQREVVRMGSFVISMLDRALEALKGQNRELAEEVIRMDDTADEMDFSIEANCMHLLALQQPMSRDLRTIATALKVITDLERIGDYAADIAQLVQRLADEPYRHSLDDITRLAQRATAMVRSSVQSFVDHDIDRAMQVCRDDDAVDELYDKVFNDLIGFMESDPSFARQGVCLVLVARRLERVADHATNMAERVNYMEAGKMEPLARMHREASQEESND